MLIVHDYNIIKSERIFTTGAHLVPIKLKDVDGNDFWMWVVDGFTDDCYNDGEVFNPPTVEKTLEKLTTDPDNEMMEDKNE